MSESSSKPTPADGHPVSLERVAIAQLFLERSSRNGRFDEIVLRELSDIHVEPGVAAITLPVSQHLQNRYGTLHGGCIATLVDVVSTAALLTVCDNSGVSLDLNCTYLSSARAGERVRVTARVLKAGRSTAVLSVELQTVGDGVLVAQGRHTKFLLGLGGLDVRQSLRSLL